MTPTPAERALYTDLTALLLRMKGEPLGLVEAAIEERFQAFVRSRHPGGCGRLEITHTYTVHDDAEPWTEYCTEYRIGAVGPAPAAAKPGKLRPATIDACGHATGNIVPFPRAFARSPSIATDVAQPGGA